MTTNSLLRVTATALFLVAACKSDFPAGSYHDGGTKDAPAQEAASRNPNGQEGGPAGSSLFSCDPFQPATKPITLTTVLGAGQDTDGTLYVVDQPQAGSERVFVSSGGTLQRQRIAGSGTESSGNRVMSYTFSISDHVPAFMLKLETNSSGPTAMGVLQGDLSGKTFTIGQQGSVLTLVSTAQVAALPVANIPAQTFIEYNATIPDGRALLVVRPRDDWTYQDLRVFFGTTDHMAERPVDQVVRYHDGGSTTINFTIDGVVAVASFPVSLTGPTTPPTLTIGAISFPLALGPTDSPPVGYTYSCLGNPSPDGGVDARVPPTDGPSADLSPGAQNCSDIADQQSCENATCNGTCDWGGPVMKVTSAPGGPLLTEVRVNGGWCTPDTCSTSQGSPSCTSLSVTTTDRTPAIGTTCDLVAVAIDGRSQSFRITVVQSGPPFNQCCGYPLPPYSGQWVTFTPMGFDPPEVVVDFNRDGGVDAQVKPADGLATCRALSPDYGPTSTFSFLPDGTPVAASTCSAACGDSAWPQGGTSFPNIDIALPYGSCTPGTPSCSTMATVPCACGGGGPVHGFNCSCEGGNWICRIRSQGAALCWCPDAGVGSPDGGNDAAPALKGVFVPTGEMTTVRYQHSATLLQNGKVLIAGGEITNPIGEMMIIYDTQGSELYDPVTGTFTATGGMNAARFGHTATLLPNGKALITGGQHRENGLLRQFLASADLYDPAAGTFTATGSMTVARYGHTATLLPSGKVLIAGGDASGTSAELYDPTAGTFTATGTVTTGAQTATLLLSGKVLVTGVDAGAELYDPAAGTFTATGRMAVARWAHTATLLPTGKVLVAGGDDEVVGIISSFASAELYDPATGSFTPTSNMTVARYGHTATSLLSGKVLIAGGYQEYLTLLASAELYDPAAGTFTATGNMAVAKYGDTATLLPSGAVLVVGGEDSGDSVLASAELYE